jgi:hypothetical protein
MKHLYPSCLISACCSAIALCLCLGMGRPPTVKNKHKPQPSSLGTSVGLEYVRWYAQLYPENKNYVEVSIDTRLLPSGWRITDVRGDLRFYDKRLTLIGYVRCSPLSRQNFGQFKL